MSDLYMFGYANAIIPFDGDSVPLIEAIKPAVVIRGEDQSIDVPRGTSLIRIPRLQGFSTTQILASHATP